MKVSFHLREALRRAGESSVTRSTLGFLVGTQLLLGLLSCSSPKYAYDFGEPGAAYSQSSPLRTESPASASIPRATEPTPFSSARTEQPLSMKSSTPMGGLPRKKAAVFEETPRQAPAQKAAGKNSHFLKSDLSRASLAAVVGISFLLIGSDTFVVLGTLALMVGVIFAIKWLFRDKK